MEILFALFSGALSALIVAIGVSAVRSASRPTPTPVRVRVDRPEDCRR
jgi:hypothetical protein